MPAEEEPRDQRTEHCPRAQVPSEIDDARKRRREERDEAARARDGAKQRMGTFDPMLPPLGRMSSYRPTGRYARVTAPPCGRTKNPLMAAAQGSPGCSIA